MKQLGLREILNVITAARMKKDKNFATRIETIANEKLRFDISDEDYQYILDNYTESNYYKD